MLAAATRWRSPADPFATASSEEYLSECPAIAILYEYAGTRRPAHEEPGSRRQDTLNSQPPALMAAALDLVAPFLTRLVSRG